MLSVWRRSNHHLCFTCKVWHGYFMNSIPSGYKSERYTTELPFTLPARSLSLWIGNILVFSNPTYSINILPVSSLMKNVPHFTLFGINMFEALSFPIGFHHLEENCYKFIFTLHCQYEYQRTCFPVVYHTILTPVTAARCAHLICNGLHLLFFFVVWSNS